MIDDKELERIVLESASDEDGKKKLACAKVFMLAAEYSVPVRRIGDCCNSVGVKIARCQLGCFD